MRQRERLAILVATEREGERAQHEYAEQYEPCGMTTKRDASRLQGHWPGAKWFDDPG
jgi:hypothetical protein